MGFQVVFLPKQRTEQNKGKEGREGRVKEEKQNCPRIHNLDEQVSKKYYWAKRHNPATKYSKDNRFILHLEETSKENITC